MWCIDLPYPLPRTDFPHYTPVSFAAQVKKICYTSVIDLLSDREKQILERVASGDSNKEIAYDLDISEKTVKHYMTNIMQKLHARNRVEAAIFAHDAGLGDYQSKGS